MTLRKRRFILLICALVFVMITPAVLLYTSGYRWSPDIGVYKTGGLYLSSPRTGSDIFVNNKLEKHTNILQSGIFLQNLKPGDYSILVAKEGFWPWAKTIQVKEQFVSEARAMLIPTEPKGEIIFRSDKNFEVEPRYEEVIEELQLVAKELKQNEEIFHTKFSPSRKEKIWWSSKKNKLWVKWLGEEIALPYFFCNESVCKKEILILPAMSGIRNANFYPNRTDIVVVSTQNEVFALEIDGRGKRVSQLIYKGREPISLVRGKESAVYILEPTEKTVLRIELK